VYIDLQELIEQYVSGCVLRELRLVLLATLQFEQQPEFLPTYWIGQVSVITDLLKSPRQDMQEEASNEFFVREPHLLAGITCPVVVILENHVLVRSTDDARIGDGDAVGVARKIVDGVAESIERFLDITAPVGLV
jgi:hypothetical protein